MRGDGTSRTPIWRRPDRRISLGRRPRLRGLAPTRPDRMSEQRFVTYARVSTRQQGQSGLGLEAQRHAVAQYLGVRQGQVIAEFVEVESGRKTNRPELAKALAACRLYGATLVVAKLDRLARNARFLLTLRDSGIDFVCADMPGANRFTIAIMAVVAEGEAEAISARTKAAYEARRRRGGNLGNTDFFKGHKGRPANPETLARRGEASRQRAADLAPIVAELRAAGPVTPYRIAASFNARGIPAPKGGLWTGSTVRRLLLLIDHTPTLNEALEVIRGELMRRGGNRERNRKIYQAHTRGRSYQSLGIEYGLGRSRVRDLCILERRRRVRLLASRPGAALDAGAELRAVLERLLMEH
jgi:DNA invertase Pin-like site-specific DNA recombinase